MDYKRSNKRCYKIVLCINKKEVKGNVNIENKWAIINKYSSLNISSEYNISGVAGYGLNLI